MSDSGKPSVLILGGVNTCGRALAELLAPPGGEALVSHLRIADKYSVSPPTTYLGASFPKVLAEPIVEYKQTNLTVPAMVSSVFDPPDGQSPYSFVFDLTGEIRHDRPQEVQIQHTFNISRHVGLESAKRNVKAFVRLQHAFYETSDKGNHDEKEDIKPLGVQGTWWHETLRMLGSIEGLNLVILRAGLYYGPYIDSGLITSTITVASVYGFLKKPMKGLWAPGKNPMNTVHVDDVAGGLWACAEWIAPLGRAEADVLAGEEIIFHNEKSKVKDMPTVVPPTQNVVAPLFNLTDDSNSTMVSTGNTVTAFFGTTFGFHNFVTNTLAKFKLEEVVEEINEEHANGWTEMITSSNPPVPKTHLSVYLDTYNLQKHTIAFDNTKIKEIVGYKLKRPELSQETLKEVVDKWKAEGSWPSLDDQ